MALFVFDFAADGQMHEADLHRPCPADHWRWVHFDLNDAATETDLRALVPASAAEILLQPETRPRSVIIAGAMIVMLRGANFNPGQQSDDMVALRIWATDTLVITLRHRAIFAVQDLRDALRGGMILPGGAGLLIAELIEGLVDRIEQVSLGLDDTVDSIEESVLVPGHDIDVLAPLPQLRRATIRLIRYLRPQSETLRKLEQRPPGAPPVLLTLPADRLHESANRAQRALEELDAVHHRLNALADHQYNRKADQLSRNGYGLSVIAAVFLPLGFVTGLFGMNVGGLPWTDTPLGFVIVCLGMAAAVALVILVLRLLRLI
ncbi:CorA family divalent cation transporter [Marinovum sp. 2_MG-2023]|uniref:CorA family divalent cation transporter n=1 Tax=Roseobacteraceae TaxID=2854170 RepID=UPI001FD01140|nr:MULTISPECIES: CorA family divalent cation transporter [Roseobacteraceae]MCJ7873715.1 zinc transporter ZntB [Phaeobacter sp. J2-8]MDO6730504.1 CorA family divalent cation transporter [Marinovum sp. 2_MG-2023]MDO6778484.1 CorA family divalent cation transporter [Marinovum sp. 1_MG-2023]